MLKNCLKHDWKRGNNMYENNFTKALYDALTPEYDNLIHDTVEAHVFSAKFEKKMKKLIKRRKKTYYRIINTVGKRVACAVLAFLVASSVTVLSVKALREAVADFFISIYEKFSTVQPINEEDTAPLTIEEIYGITYGIEGYEIILEEKTDSRFFRIYVKDNIVIYFSQYIKDAYAPDINTENAEIITIDINGYSAMYFLDNNDFHNLIWDNGEYIINIDSNCGKDALIDIAKSVQKVE